MVIEKYNSKNTSGIAFGGNLDQKIANNSQNYLLKKQGNFKGNDDQGILSQKTITNCSKSAI